MTLLQVIKENIFSLLTIRFEGERFSKRILRSHPNVWIFIESLKKKKTETMLALEVRLKLLSTRFENDKIDRKQYLERLTFFVANKK